MLEQLARQNVQLEGEIAVRRQAEQALHRAHDDLEGLVAQRTAELAQANESIRRSESYLAEAQRLSLTGSFSWRPPSGEIIWSEETFRIYGYSSDMTPTLDLARRRIHPDDLALFEEEVRHAAEQGRDFHFEHRLLMPDGAAKHLKVTARAMKNETGRLVEFIGAVLDVTAAKLAEEKLRQDERELRRITDAIPTPSMCWRRTAPLCTRTSSCSTIPASPCKT
jgi:PAS domain S-box-containing protein